MYSFHFTRSAEKEWHRLDESIRKNLQTKLIYLKDPILLRTHMKIVQHLLPATHRIRIGNYRLLIEIQDDTVIIHSVGHRREIYQ